MVRALSQIFDIKTGEWPKFLWMFFFYFLSGTQFVVGISVSESLFLREIGFQYLPYMYIFNAAVVMAISTFYVSFADRIDNAKLFVLILSLYLVIILTVRGLIFLDIRFLGVKIAYPLLHATYVSFVAMVVTHFGAFIADYYDTLESKRLYPLIYSGARIGGILCGLGLPFIVGAVGGSNNLIFFWAASMGASMLIVGVIRARFVPLTEAAARPRGKKLKVSTAENMREGLRYIRQSRFLQVFAIFTLALIILRYFMEFEYSIIFQATFPEKDRLTAFYGVFAGVASIFALGIQLFLTPRLIQKLGVGLSNIVYPFSTAASFLALALSFSFLPALYMRFNKTSLQESLRNPLHNLLYNAVPLNLRGRSRAFIVGFVGPLGSVIGGLILIVSRSEVLGSSLSPVKLAYLGLGISLGYIFLGFLQRRQYTQALLGMLEQRQFGLFRFAQGGFGTMEPATYERLVKSMREDEEDVSIFAAHVLAETGVPGGAEALMEVVEARPGPVAREALALLGKVEVEDEGRFSLFRHYLQHPEPAMRSAALSAVAESGSYGRLVEEVHMLVDDQDPTVRSSAITLMVKGGDLFCMAEALTALNAMLRSSDPLLRGEAISTIGALGNRRFIKTLLPYLQDEEPPVRVCAARSIEQLEDGLEEPEEGYLAALTACLKDPSEGVRLPLTRVLGRLGTEAAVDHLVEALLDPSFRVREAAMEALETLGQKAALQLEKSLSHKAFEVRWPASLLLGRISGESFRNRLNQFAMEELKLAYENLFSVKSLLDAGLASKASMMVKTFMDLNGRIAEMILRLLGVMGDEEAVKVIYRSLGSSDSLLRANALETLENVTSRDARDIVLALEPILSGIALEDKLEVGRRRWGLKGLRSETVMARSLGSSNKWAVAITLFSLGRVLEGNGGVLSKERFASALLACVKDEDPYVREAAVEALGKLSDGSPAFLEAIRSALTDPNPLVVRQAIRSLVETPGEREQLILNVTDEGVVSTMLSTIEKAMFLKRVSIFENMTSEQLKIISNICSDVRFEKGKVIFEEGDLCDYFYIIADGKVDIVQNLGTDREKRLVTLEREASFGEMAIFGDETRSASAVVSGDATLLTIDKEHLKELIRNYPDISFQIIRSLTEIIRRYEGKRSSSETQELSEGPARS